MAVSGDSAHPYAAAAAESLTRLAGLGAAVYAGLAVLRPALNSGPTGFVMSGAAALVCLALAALALAVHFRRLPAHLVEPLTAAGVVVVTADCCVQIVLTGDPAQTTGVMLAAVAAGAVLVSSRWLVPTLYLVWLGWGGAVAYLGRDAAWLHFGASLALASALSVLVHIARRRALDALAAERKTMRDASVIDELTGLSNRRGMPSLTEPIIEAARRGGDAVHCVLLEIDPIAAAEGLPLTEHQAARDAVLLAVADALRGATRATDVIGRWGDDGFCVVGPGAGTAPLDLERRVRARLAARPPLGAAAATPGVRAAGAMLAPWDAGAFDSLLGKADQEMYLRRTLRGRTGDMQRRRTAPDH